MRAACGRLTAAAFLALALGNCGVGDAPSETARDLAVLALEVEGFEQARDGVALEFPRDHGAHPGFRIEWWYLTANLTGPDGAQYGVQWTLFRIAARPQGSEGAAAHWHDNQIYMAHVGVSTPDEHVAYQRYSSGHQVSGEARAGVTAEPFAAWLDDWVLHSTGDQLFPMRVRAKQEGQMFDLELRNQGPLVLQGDAGFSQKHHDGGGSFYYNLPFIEVSGELKFDDELIPVSGQAWLDREWSSRFLAKDQVGWDWFSLHLDSGEKLMLFRLRQQGGSNMTGDFISGALVAPDGSQMPLQAEQVKLTVLEHTRVRARDLPLHWQIELYQADRRLEVRALHPGQWMDVDFPYWEGVIIATGDGPGSRGRGFMELTGYPEISR